MLAATPRDQLTKRAIVYHEGISMSMCQHSLNIRYDTIFNKDKCHYLFSKFLHRISIQTMIPNPTNRTFLTRFAWLSIGAAVITITLKTVAYLLTSSVGLLSDALESIVNLVGAMMALAMLTIAARPADEDHTYGHSKAEYFSSGVEGTLILIAAISIVITAIPRLITPKPLEQIGLGLAITRSLGQRRHADGGRLESFDLTANRSQSLSVDFATIRLDVRLSRDARM